MAKAPDFDSQLAAMEAAAPMAPEPGDADFPTHDGTQSEFDPEDVTEGGAEGEAVYSSEEDDDGAQPAQGAADPKKAADPKAGAQAADAGTQALKAIETELGNMKAQAKQERERRRASDAALAQRDAIIAQNQREMAEMQALFNQITNPAPDPETNIVEAYKHLQAQLQRQQAAQAARQQAAQQTQQQLQFTQRFKSTVEDFEAEFTQTQPDYPEASDWLVAQEQKRLEMLGMAPDQAERESINVAVQLARIALQNGKNPAEVAWALAQQQGFKPKREAEAAAAAAAQPNGQQKIAQLKQGAAAAKTMGGGGTKDAAGQPTLKHANSLDGAAGASAREKWLNDMIKGKQRA